MNRFAEAMTIFAVMCAGIFPGIHVGRVWLAWLAVPDPELQMAIWPNFRSPLLWDVFAVSTYATVSLLFWYMGMIPDLATLRDRAKSKPKFARPLGPGTSVIDLRSAFAIYGWRWAGVSSRHWHRYEKAYLLLAALATPLVLSACTRSCRSTSRLASCRAGTRRSSRPTSSRVRSSAASRWCCCWRSRCPGAVPNFKDSSRCVTSRTWPRSCSLTGMIVGFAYMMEFFIAWYGGVSYEQFAFANRALGPYGGRSR
jgi:hypothetical protein